MLTGKFPNWRNVVENSGTKNDNPAVRADRLRDGMRRAAICTSETSLAVACKFAEAVVIRSKRPKTEKPRNSSRNKPAAKK